MNYKGLGVYAGLLSISGIILVFSLKLLASNLIDYRASRVLQENKFQAELISAVPVASSEPTVSTKFYENIQARSVRESRESFWAFIVSSIVPSVLIISLPTSIHNCRFIIL